MLFAAILGASGNPYAMVRQLQEEKAELQREVMRLSQRLGEQATAIEEKQNALKAETEAAIGDRMYVYPARGLQTYLMRFAYRDLFQRERPGRLTRRREQLFRQWGQKVAPLLTKLAGPTTPVEACVDVYEERRRAAGKARIDPLRAREKYTLVEIQIQGHCRGGLGDEWRISLDRARDVARVLQGVDNFPRYLLSVAGYSWHRRVFLVEKPHHPALPDRIDVRFVFSGDQDDSTFVNPYLMRGGREVLLGPPSVNCLPIYCPWRRNDAERTADERREPPRVDET